MHVRGIPFDAPLYEADSERGVEYWNCAGVTVLFTVKGPVRTLLPDGLVPAGDPPVGAVMFNRYRAGTAGAHLEQISMLQVRTRQGETGVYVPYAYVTTDVAMASRREGFGYPAKLAAVELTRWADIVQGTLERPPGKRLLTVTMKPFERMDRATRAVLVSDELHAFTMRHLPGANGHGGVTQLVSSTWQTLSHKDARGNEIVLTGPVSLTYDSPSIIDPVHKLEAGEIIAGVYREFDGVLKLREILSESHIPYRAVADRH